MRNPSLLLFIFASPLLLAACSHLADPGHAAGQGFFADADRCQRLSLRTEPVKVTTGRVVTVIDVPLAHDAGLFSQCMALAGHAPPKIDPQRYLDISARCLDAARGADDPEQAYALCVRQQGIEVEAIPN